MMQAFLHSDFVLVKNTLHDQRLGTRYSLSDDAVRLLGQLQAESRLDQLVVQISSERQLAVPDVRRTVLAFFGELASTGGLLVNWRPAYGRILQLRGWATWPKRQPISLYGFVNNAVRAYGCLAIVAIGAGAILRPLIPGFVLVFISCIVHEAAHAGAAYILKARAILLSQLGYMAVIYVPPGVRQQRYIAAVGPLAAVFVCLASTCFMRHGDLLLMAVAAAHLCSLLPWFADGKAVWSRS